MALARRGDTVLCVSRNEREVQDRANEIREAGLDARGFACDLSDADAVAELARHVRSEYDHLDALVNLAGGFGMSGKISDSDPATLQRMLQINLLTAYLTTRAFAPLVIAARGSIVFFASEAVLESSRTAQMSAYAAAKAGVVALMRSVSDELRKDGVRANALAPASIRTASNEQSMGPDGSYVERDEVAATVAFLCSPAASAITGQVIRLR